MNICNIVISTISLISYYKLKSQNLSDNIIVIYLFLPLLSAFHPSHFKGRWNDKWLPNWGYWQKADIWHYTQFVTVMTNQPGGNGFWYKKQSILVILVWHFKKLGQDSSRLEYMLFEQWKESEFEKKQRHYNKLQIFANFKFMFLYQQICKQCVLQCGNSRIINCS